jgi:hypothetical protein
MCAKVTGVTPDNSVGLTLLVWRRANQSSQRLPMPWMRAVAPADPSCIPARHPDPGRDS